MHCPFQKWYLYNKSPFNEACPSIHQSLLMLLFHSHVFCLCIAQYQFYMCHLHTIPSIIEFSTFNDKPNHELWTAGHFLKPATISTFNIRDTLYLSSVSACRVLISFKAKSLTRQQQQQQQQKKNTHIPCKR